MPEIIEKTTLGNRVLTEDYRPSRNFHQSDRVLRHYLEQGVSPEGQRFMAPRWQRLGEQAAGVMNELSLLADRHGPELVRRNWLGETVNHIRFHPAYEALKEIAVDSGMFFVK